ncbi:MAG: glycosyltransferase family 4 protein [Planctomycetes bacterium]|nr:glycosyltransferase family 4 protein [Planctomycetota bacterium]
MPKRSIAILGNYLPRKCGIATFTKDVCESVADRLGDSSNVFAIAMTNRPEGYSYPDIVRFDIQDQMVSDYEKAADFINLSKVDVLCVQHEYGIFGGDWGEYLQVLLRKVNVPVVTVFHTVLEKPADDKHKKVFGELVQRSDRLIVLAERALKMLVDQGVPKEKISFIPHGIPDLPFEDTKKYKKEFDLEDKTMLLTFGLLSSDKGIEYAIDAVAQLVPKFPDLVYVVLGATHPDIIKHHGEQYRHSLMRKVEKLGLKKNVLFHDRFVELDELCEYISAADFYIVPYLKKEQIVSGTLAYATGSGKAVISTGSWCAEEMLANGRGAIVPFKDGAAIAKAIENLLDSPKELAAMKKKAYQFGRRMIWPEVAKQYLNEFDSIQKKRPEIVSVREKTKKPILLTSQYPIPKLNHVKTMTDDFALLQHARYTIPNYRHGYCVDDNARAIVVATKFYRLMDSDDALFLLRKYLAFLSYAQREDGRFRNFFSVTKESLDEVGSDDCQGRALWGLGYAIAYGPEFYGTVTYDSFHQLLPHIEKGFIRGTAYSLLGLYYYLIRYPDHQEILTIMTRLADKMVEDFKNNADKNWSWFEDKLTYANGLLPVSMWISYYSLKQDKYREVAEKASSFLIENSLKEGHLSPIGCNGWHKKGEKRAQYDQQPVDALWMVELGKFAYRFTQDEDYLKLMKTSFDWFLGDNDRDVAVYDRVTGGCFDGLCLRGTNINQGAESTLSAVLSLLSITEMAHQQSVGEEEFIESNA